LAGSVLTIVCLGGLSYNLWRVQRDLRAPLLARATTERRVYAAALEAAGGDSAALCGRLDRLPCAQSAPWCLPGPAYSALWLDDPQVARQLRSVLHTVPHDPAHWPPAAVRAVLVWETPQPRWLSDWQRVAPVYGWHEVATAEPGACLWQRSP
jgi:hypothetical protein